MIPGWGYRIANDVLLEMSFHLVQPGVYQLLPSPVTAGAAVTVTVGTTAAMYPGAQLLAGPSGGSDTEIITILSVPSGTQFTANFANNHAASEPIWGATFPVQYDTDPLFTQSEMLQYLSRAQNEFLVAVPSFYSRFFQNVSTSLIYQSLPATAVLVDRIAASQLDLGISTLVRSGNLVTLTSVIPHGLSQYNTFAVVGATNSSFNGAFAVASAPTPTTLTYLQIGANASTTGGSMQQMARLYEFTQEELTMRNRNWQASSGPLTSWFEDRAGLYKWGVGEKPDSNYPVEILAAIRDTDTLGLLDGFAVPDVSLHGIKWLSLAYSWSKDGVVQNIPMADFCMKRYTQVVLATQRYIGAMKMGIR